MKEETVAAWLKKANDDIQVGINECAAAIPVPDAIAFHSQQCVEKCLKAFLVYHSAAFRKTHVLAELIQGCMEIEPEFQRLYVLNADRLTEYAVEARYPADFESPSLEEAKKALHLAEQVRDFVMQKLQRKGFGNFGLE